MADDNASSERRSEIFRFRLSEPEAQAFRAFCDNHNLSVTEAMRRMARGAAGLGPTFSGEGHSQIVELTRQVRAVGVNLNQAVHHMNAGHAFPADEMRSWLQETLGVIKALELYIRRSRSGLDRELTSQLSSAVRDESRRPFARRPHGVCRSPLVGGAPQGLSAPHSDRPVGSAGWDARFRRRRARQERRVGDGSARGASWGRSGCAIHAQPGPRRTAGSSTRPASSSSLPAIGGGGTAPRSPLLSKAKLATGSQAAVVKLASYGSGPARAAALLNYQSHKGELTLERQDGTMIVGAREVAHVAASWESSNRAPSNDVLSFKIRIDGPMTPEAAQTGLQRALKGHDYAWTFAHDGAAAHIGVVMAAASSERDDKGRLERVYGNDSLDQRAA